MSELVDPEAIELVRRAALDDLAAHQRLEALEDATAAGLRAAFAAGAGWRRPGRAEGRPRPGRVDLAGLKAEVAAAEAARRRQARARGVRPVSRRKVTQADKQAAWDSYERVRDAYRKQLAAQELLGDPELAAAALAIPPGQVCRYF